LRCLWKKSRNGAARSGTLPHVPARLKLTYGKQTKLLAALTAGFSLSAACRAVGISRMTVQRHMRADPQFREAVRACRERRVPDPMVALAELDWREAAARLEAMAPEHWRPQPPLPDPWELG
jgi:hypothetical protein